MANKELGFKLTKQIEGIKRSMNRVTYETISAIVIRLDEVSPVADAMLWKNPDPKYVGGQFRGNWQLGVDKRPIGWLPGNIDPTGGETVAKNLGTIPVMASRHTYYLLNNTPYGRYLEDGSVKMCVYPHAFVYRVKREVNGIVRQIAAQIKSEGGRVK